MKGIILAGGHATRLRPLTWVTNKHLLPVYNKPMIYYALESMQRAGIKEVLLITNPDHAGHFINLLRSGADFGLRLFYEIQNKPGGIAEGIGIAETFARNSKTLVLLGDNIFTHNLRSAVNDFKRQKTGAKVFAKKMPTESGQYGVIELDPRGRVVSIEEKPKIPKSDLAQTGIYMYDERVFEFIKSLIPSKRGELEVSDLNSAYVKEGTMTCEVMEGWWVDAGTSFDELLRANILVKKLTTEDPQTT